MNQANGAMNGVPVGGTWVWVLIIILAIALLATSINNLRRK